MGQVFLAGLSGTQTFKPLEVTPKLHRSNHREHPLDTLCHQIRYPIIDLPCTLSATEVKANSKVSPLSLCPRKNRVIQRQDTVYYILIPFLYFKNIRRGGQMTSVETGTASDSTRCRSLTSESTRDPIVLWWIQYLV